MLTIATISIESILLWFVGGFFLGLGWTLGAWVISRTVGRIP
jgi:uncharacterized membrane protein YccF (DUF307 family)